jgi:hypothetical protein
MYKFLSIVEIKISSVTGEVEKNGHMKLNGPVKLNSNKLIIPNGKLEIIHMVNTKL